VRKSNQLWLALSILFSLPALAGTAFHATTTLTAETSNNTSTADAFTTQTNNNLGAANISKVPMSSLLYPGSTAKIYAHFMPWFGFGDHMSVGYISTDTLQIQKQVNDMISRGLDGAIIDWYGRGTFSKRYVSYDQATQSFMHESQLHPGFSFAITHDSGALKTCSTTLGCDVTQTLIDDLNYANVTYFSSPAYLTYGGRPVVYFFGQEAYNIDWTQVRAGVAGNPMFIFRNASGFSSVQGNGAFSWVAPETVTATNLMALNYLNNYYKTATVSFPSAYSTGSGYKGFNDTLALWGSNRIIDQQCGQTWLQTIADAGKYYSTTRQLPGLQIVTWNDYEEGSEIESGINNCVAVSASVAGTAVSWSITGQMNTVDHFSIFASQDGENLMWLADAPTSATSLDLAGFNLNSGNYIVYVKATGKPSLTNQMSAGVQLTVPNQPPVAALSITPSNGTAPVTVNASTAGSSDADGAIASISIDFGDGSAAASGASASHVYSISGTYTVTATVTDNLGAASVKSASVVVTAANKPPVAALSVTSSSGVAPASISASTAGSSDPDGTIAAVSIDFGDGTPAVSAAGASHVYNTPGTYTITATVTDNQGASSVKSASVVISAPNKPPVATLSATPASAYGPVTVSVSAAGSSDPDGAIAATVLHFGDGTSANSATATHTYSAAGVYTITATVTDNQGASSSASADVTVKAPEVIVSSPANGASVASQVHVVASGFSGYTVTAMQIYLDSVLAYKVNAANLDTTLTLTSGVHAMVVKGWDSAGRSFSRSLSIAATNQPPVAALSLSAASVLTGGSITASAAGSSDPDGTIASTVIDFGDGVSTAAVSASHQYTTAGSYTVKTKVTDNLGAVSTASAMVTVNPAFVTITSPTFTSTSNSSVWVTGKASSGYTVIATQVYLDGTLKFKSTTNTADTTLSLNQGTHQITIQAWDSSGAVFKSSVTVTRK
jgi:PKD repeat protein